MSVRRLIWAMPLLRAMCEHEYCYQHIGNAIHVAGKYYADRDLVEHLHGEGLVIPVSVTRWKITQEGRAAVAVVANFAASE